MKNVCAWIADPGLKDRPVWYVDTLVLYHGDSPSRDDPYKLISSGEIRLSVPFGAPLGDLIASLNSPKCTINTLELNGEFLQIMEHLARGQLPRIMRVAFDCDVYINDIYYVLRSPRSSVRTMRIYSDCMVFSLGPKVTLEILADLDCRVTNFQCQFYERTGRLYEKTKYKDAIKMRHVKAACIVLGSARSRVGRKSALQHLDRVLVRYLGTFLV
jgi:hypothetical protein